MGDLKGGAGAWLYLPGATSPLPHRLHLLGLQVRGDGRHGDR
jgi:hypothetical protein